MRWTQEQLTAYELRNRPTIRSVPDEGVDLESPLQEQIEAECRRRGWVCVRTRMDCRNTFTMLGVCDLIIAASNGKVYWIETKRKNAKQTTEQIGFQMMLERNGHVYSLIRSYSEFLAVISTAATPS